MIPQKTQYLDDWVVTTVDVSLLSSHRIDGHIYKDVIASYAALREAIQISDRSVPYIDLVPVVAVKTLDAPSS